MHDLDVYAIRYVILHFMFNMCNRCFCGMYILFNTPCFELFFILICSMLNKLSNGEKITKNKALQREIWGSEIGSMARVFRKNPSKSWGWTRPGGVPPLAPGGVWWSMSLTSSSVRPPVCSVVTIIVYGVLVKFLIIFLVIKNN